MGLGMIGREFRKIIKSTKNRFLKVLVWEEKKG